MEKFIPINKKSKKAQKEYYAKKRNTWGELNPMTRTMPNEIRKLILSIFHFFLNI